MGGNHNDHDDAEGAASPASGGDIGVGANPNPGAGANPNPDTGASAPGAGAAPHYAPGSLRADTQVSVPGIGLNTLLDYTIVESEDRDNRANRTSRELQGMMERGGTSLAAYDRMIQKGMDLKWDLKVAKYAKVVEEQLGAGAEFLPWVMTRHGAIDHRCRGWLRRLAIAMAASAFEKFSARTQRAKATRLYCKWMDLLSIARVKFEVYILDVALNKVKDSPSTVPGMVKKPRRIQLS
jgi:hypothetical protein